MIFYLDIKIKNYLMLRYCPNYLKETPNDDNGTYQAEAIVVTGYRSDSIVVAKKTISGKINAYREARWLVLKARWLRPKWLFDCGIQYGIKRVHNGK